MNLEIEVGLAERIQLIGAFNSVKGDVETLRSVLEDLKEISITEEEKTESNFRETGDGQVRSFAWDKDIPKKVKLSQKTADFLMKHIEARSTEGSLALSDMPLLNVQEKIKKTE